MNIRTSVSDDELNQMIEEVKPLTKGFGVLTDHVIITDTDGNIIYANKAAEDATGYTTAEMLGKNPGDLWGGHMPRELYKDLWNTIKVLKKSWHARVINCKKDGTEYEVSLRINPILDSSGDCCFFVAIEPTINNSVLSEPQLRDAITAKTQLYDFYAGKSLAAEDLNKLVDRFIAELKETKNKNPGANSSS